VLEVEGGAITSHEGNYEDYLRRKGLAAGSPSVAASPREKPQEPAAPDGNGNGAGEDTDSEAKDRPRRLNPIKQKQMGERCAFLEEETPRIEAAIAHTEAQLGVYVSASETERLTALAGELRAQLAEYTAEWEELMMQLDGQGTSS
jgi:ATP-binding cassette subfamily F protein 3